MVGLISGAFAGYLEAHRSEINARVAETRRTAPGFDPADFAEVLAGVLPPIVEAVDRRGEGFTAVVAEVLVEAALELCAGGRFGGAVRSGWEDLLPVVAGPLTADPRVLVASVTNALANLEESTSGRPGRWTEIMVAVAGREPTVGELLRAGQVGAWRCGMAPYREGALEIAGGLGEDLLALALGATPAELARMGADPWFDPGNPPARPGPIRVGGFRGFGGTFLRPPTLTLDPTGRVVADDGVERWLVFADCFGSAVIRAGEAGGSATPGPGGPPPPALAQIPELTSWVAVAGGLAASSALGHAVTFLPGAVA